MNKLFQDDFRQFLVEAKKQTYASENSDADVAKPLLPGSKQLDWCRGNLLYRDVYFGSAFFAGLETVFKNDTPIWAMSYSGGVIARLESQDVGALYTFLKLALEQVPVAKPYRGLEVFDVDDFTYHMKSEGEVERFSGKEEIFLKGILVYKLDFSGGWIT